MERCATTLLKRLTPLHPALLPSDNYSKVSTSELAARAAEAWARLGEASRDLETLADQEAERAVARRLEAASLDRRRAGVALDGYRIQTRAIQQARWIRGGFRIQTRSIQQGEEERRQRLDRARWVRIDTAWWHWRATLKEAAHDRSFWRGVPGRDRARVLGEAVPEFSRAWARSGEQWFENGEEEDGAREGDGAQGRVDL
ncbi:hypothetical protein T484DRAFT_1825207 [Baffinella frigidus]|nr:hypothetical protein T484DRAFT_1825207 [Cryptophyta sp. CCMP2293]